MSVDATIATWKLPKTKVTATQKLLLLSLADRAGENGECWPSLQRLMADTNLGRQAIIDNRQELISKGLIVYTGQKKGRQRQIPVMRLTYIQNRENSTEPEKGPGQKFTSHEIGTGKSFTSHEIVTGTSHEIVTLNLKEEPKINTSEQSSPAVLTFSEITPVELIRVYEEELPENPRVAVNNATGSIDSKVLKRIAGFKRNWFAKYDGNPLTCELFRLYLQGLKQDVPQLAVGIHKLTRRRNGLMTFLDVMFFENYINGNYF